MRKHPYQKLLDRKRKWSPEQTTAGELKHGAASFESTKPINGSSEKIK